MPEPEQKASNGGRNRIASAFRFVEQGLYFGVAVALTAGGIWLLADVVRAFLGSFRSDPRVAILELLDGMLLVFILAELIHTIRAVIHENVLRTEPFLIVGIVAAIRRVLVITADAERRLGQPVFRDLLIEMSVLMLGVLLLGVTIYLVRHTTHSEPTPAHEKAASEDERRPR